MYTVNVNDYGVQEEFYENTKLEKRYNHEDNLEIYYNIINKYDECYSISYFENKSSALKGLIIDDLITPLMDNDCKLHILNDIEIACEDFNSRQLRENIMKIMKAIENGDIKYNRDYESYEYNDEFRKIKSDIVLFLYDFCDKYEIEYSDVYFKPYGNGFADIVIDGSNRIEEQQLNAIERIIRGYYDYGDVKFNRDGDIKRIEHHFRTKYYVGRYVK